MTAIIILITLLGVAGMAFLMWGFASEDHQIAIGSWLLHPSLPHPQQDKREAAALACRQAIERLEADLNTSDAPDIVTFTGWTLADDLRRRRIRREEQEQRNRKIAHSLGMVTAQEAMENFDAVFRDLHK